ncbi:MAG: 60S ribosomal protein L31 [Sulfolobales archaeon]|nr:60S ribosomal protein L31 [Sulfolobales archaeon]
MSESVFIISLSKLYRTRRYRRAARAVKCVRNFIKRHTKAEKVLLDSSISTYVFSRRYDKPPRRIAVAVMKLDQEGKVVKASLAVRIKPQPGSEGSTQ